MLRAALHLAHSHGDAGAEDQARDLLARLAAGRFRFAVIGQFSRGKSTLMNALLGGAYLPMGALPMTSVITTVRYGTRPRAMIRRRRAALPVEVPLAQVADYVAASSLRRAEMRVADVEVEVPAEILRLGFEFVDTLGIGSSLTANTAATRRFLPQADAVIFVTGYGSPLTEAEAGLLADAPRHAGRLFLILNKRDLVSDRDAGQVQDFVRHRLHGLGAADPRVYGLSADTSPTRSPPRSRHSRSRHARSAPRRPLTGPPGLTTKRTGSSRQRPSGSATACARHLTRMTWRRLTISPPGWGLSAAHWPLPPPLARRQRPGSQPAVRPPGPDAAGARCAHSWRKPSPDSYGAGSSCSPPATPTRDGLPGPAGCTLCQTLASRERDAVTEAAAQAPDSPLCLRHLAMALTAGPPPAAGRAMIRALAKALRADGEDMRDYALKREALHNSLVTDEESRAHQDALRRLAGLSVLTMPWAATDL